jgi:hypothetical protein
MFEEPSHSRADRGQPVDPVLRSPSWRRGGADELVPAYPCADPYCSRGESASARPVCALAGALQRLLRWLPISQRGCPYRRDGYGLDFFHRVMPGAQRLAWKWVVARKSAGHLSVFGKQRLELSRPGHFFFAILATRMVSPLSGIPPASIMAVIAYPSGLA